MRRVSAKIQGGSERSTALRAFTAGLTVAVPVLAGYIAGHRWPAGDAVYYASAAQIIATLFIAITVELFAPKTEQAGIADTANVVPLTLITWFGFFASIRALVGDPTDLTVGFSAAGLTAASLLVSFNIYDRIASRGSVTDRDRIVGALYVLSFAAAAIVALGH